MKWFSLSGIRQEAKKVRWPKREELFKGTYTAISFIIAFAIFFIISDFLVGVVLRLLGVIA